MGMAGRIDEYVANSSRAPQSPKKPLAGRRVLLAEDEGLIALELERMLVDFGCEVVGPVASVDGVLKKPKAAVSTARCSTSTSGAGKSSKSCRGCKASD